MIRDIKTLCILSKSAHACVLFHMQIQCCAQPILRMYGIILTSLLKILKDYSWFFETKRRKERLSNYLLVQYAPREQRLSTFTVICSCRCACCIAQDGRQLAIADWRWRGGLFDRRLVVPAQAGASNFDRDYTNFIVYAPSRWLKHWVSSHEQQYRTRVPVLEKSNIICEISSDAWQSDFVHWHRLINNWFAENFTRVSILYCIVSFLIDG